MGRNEGPGARGTHVAPPEPALPRPSSVTEGPGIPVLATQRPLAASAEAPAQGR